MGTHPIFESDFDCLTDKLRGCLTEIMTEVITVAVPVVVAQCVDRTVVEEVAGDHTLAIVAVMVVAMTVAVKIVVADMAVAIVVIVMVAMIVVEAVVAASVKIADHPFLLEISHGHPPKKNLLIYSVNMEKLPISDSLWTVKQIAHVEWVSVNSTQKNHVNP